MERPFTFLKSMEIEGAGGWGVGPASANCRVFAQTLTQVSGSGQRFRYDRGNPDQGDDSDVAMNGVAGDGGVGVATVIIP